MQPTRRGFLTSGLVGAGATAIGVSAPEALAADSVSSSRVVPFYGTHQAGIATPSQNYLQFASFDVLSDSLADLRKLLRKWSEAAAQMSLGRRIGPVQTGSRPPVDTGEAVGLGPSELTVTFGFGRSLFSSNGKDRFGLAKHKPAPLVTLPPFQTDALQGDICGGDIGVQVCANDPQVAFHAVHDLIKLARPVAKPRWLLAGFGRTGNTRHAPLPRNLMGFQDGTANIKAEDRATLNRYVWAKKPASPGWMVGGSYLVARRIQIDLGRWDRTSLHDQQQTIGREKLSGALLAVPPAYSHVLLASPPISQGGQILRRGYSYVDGVDKATGDPATGLMFLCYQADPRRQFIKIQAGLAVSDALSAFISHIGSAVFACPPGAKAGGFVGQELVG